MPVRVKAFLLHLAGSAIIALLVLLLVFGLWYPAPLHLAVGVTDIFMLLLLIDVTLGPLLTLLVYKTGKKTLVLDLAVIVCLQLSALSYGLWTVTQGRPAWLVFNVDRFDLVKVVDIDTQRLDAASPEYRTASWVGPRWVGAAPPDDRDQQSDLVFESLMGGSDIPQRPDLYRPLTELTDQLHSQALPLQQLHALNPPEQVRDVLARWPEADGWVPLMARAQPMVVLLNKVRGEVLAVVDLRPWN